MELLSGVSHRFFYNCRHLGVLLLHRSCQPTDRLTLFYAVFIRRNLRVVVSVQAGNASVCGER